MNDKSGSPSFPVRITLVSRNAEINGARFPVNRSKFLIGRHDDCDLRLKSRSVSRRHCQIAILEGQVLIRDLGSRNGTIVNASTCDAKRWRVLWHDDMLKIGKRIFRVSIRDAKTRRPITPDQQDGTQEGLSTRPATKSLGEAADLTTANKSVEELFRELDEMTAGFDFDSASDHESAIDVSDLPRSDDTTMDESMSAETTVQPEVATASAEPPDDSVLPAESASGTDQDAVDAPVKRKIGKLPERVKPKPADSRIAAEEAMKRFFDRR